MGLNGLLPGRGAPGLGAEAPGLGAAAPGFGAADPGVAGGCGAFGSAGAAGVGVAYGAHTADALAALTPRFVAPDVEALAAWLREHA